MESYDVANFRVWCCGKQLRRLAFLRTLLSLTINLGFTYYDYPRIYNYWDFHHCGLEPGDNIVNYNNAQEVWTCQLGGLAEYV